MSMKHPSKNHGAADKKRRLLSAKLKQEKKARRLQLRAARTKG